MESFRTRLIDADHFFKVGLIEILLNLLTQITKHDFCLVQTDGAKDGQQESNPCAIDDGHSTKIHDKTVQRRLLQDLIDIRFDIHSPMGHHASAQNQNANILLNDMRNSKHFFLLQGLSLSSTWPFKNLKGNENNIKKASFTTNRDLFQ